jgi:cytochrome c oxidase subunit 3
MLCLIATEASLFAYLLFSYYYIAVQRGGAWLPAAHPSLALAGPNTLVLLSSSVAVWWGEEGVKKGRRRQQLIGLLVSAVLGAIFAGVQTIEWASKPYRLNSGSYGSLFFTVTGFHMAHVLAGVGMLSLMLIWSAMGYFTPRRHAAISIVAIYWHFVDAVWLVVFFTFYITPHLGLRS